MVRPKYEVDLDPEIDPIDPPKFVSAQTQIPEQTLANWRSTKPSYLPFLKVGAGGRMVRYRRSVWRAVLLGEGKAAP